MTTLRKPRVITVIPAFNEEGRVGQVIQRIPRDVVDEIIVVNDHSTDSTEAESLRAGASVISKNWPRGVGAAVKAGYQEGLRRAGDVLVVVAGDAQHDPTEIPKLLNAIQAGQADYVTSDRLSNAPIRHGMPPFRYIGNILLTLLTRLVTRIDVKDSQCGFTAITRKALETIEMKRLPDSWGITNGLLAECGRNHLRMKCVPISTHYGARESYIRLPSYVPLMTLVLLRALFRTTKRDSRGKQ